MHLHNFTQALASSKLTRTLPLFNEVSFCIAFVDGSGLMCPLVATTSVAVKMSLDGESSEHIMAYSLVSSSPFLIIMVQSKFGVLVSSRILRSSFFLMIFRRFV